MNKPVDARVFRLAVLLLPLVCLAATGGGMPENEDEKVLKKAGIGTDGPGLLKYFKDRSPNEAERARLAGLVAKLGNGAYRVREMSYRELIAGGEASLPFLKAAVTNHPLEMKRRAEACIREIEQVPYALRTGAATRLLALRKPAGAAATLLDYLPFADWDSVGDDLLQALSVIGLQGDVKNRTPLPIMLEATRDKEPRRRIAAAHVLGYVGPEHSQPLAALVGDDNTLVRFHAAASLIRCKDGRGVPALVGLLENAAVPLACRAEDILLRLAGDKSPAISGNLDETQVRRKWHADWETWWKENRARIDWAKVNLDEAALGLTLVCEIDGLGHFPGRVTALQRNGAQQAWSIEGLDSPTDMQWLGGGRILVAEHWVQRVTERNRQGEILRKWEFPDKPVSCRRLPNGNTFVATYTEIVELTPTGDRVYTHKQQGMIYCACPLPNQHVLFISSSGMVIELDRAGKQVRSFTPNNHAGGASYWASIVPLPNGRYLIGLAGNGKVVETDDTGKIHWECSVSPGGSANALRNGNVLVVSTDGRFVVEVDRQQKEIWRKATKGRPFWARPY